MKNSNRKITRSYTCLECKSCKNMSKRKFEVGDIVFQSVGKCTECNNELMVTMIFGETIE